MSKIRTLLYPYSRRIRAYVKYHKTLSEELELVSLVSPKGWGLEGDKVEALDQKYIVKTSFEEELESCDAVLFCEDGEYVLEEEILKEKLQLAQNNGKRILFSRKETLLFCNNKLEQNVKLENQKYRIHPLFARQKIKIDIPIIAIISTNDNYDYCEVLLGMKHIFEKEGYKVLGIGNVPNLPLNITALPDYINDESIKMNDKSILFSHFLKLKTFEEKPDVVIIALTEDTNDIIEGFDVTIKSIVSSIEIDYAILCATYDEVCQDNVEQNKNRILKEYAVNINSIHVSPYIRGEDDKFSHIKMKSMIEIDEEDVLNYISNKRMGEITYLCKYENVQNIVEKIVDELS